MLYSGDAGEYFKALGAWGSSYGKKWPPVSWPGDLKYREDPNVSFKKMNLFTDRQGAFSLVQAPFENDFHEELKKISKLFFCMLILS